MNDGLKNGIGQLRHRVIFERQVTLDDGAGGAVETWEAVATVWGAVVPLVGREMWYAQQARTATTHKVIVRHRDDIRPDMRIRHAGRVLMIQNIVTPYERGKVLEIQCQEVGA